MESINQQSIESGNKNTISKAKDSYTREEVEELCRKAFDDGRIAATSGKSLNVINDWIKENL